MSDIITDVDDFYEENMGGKEETLPAWVDLFLDEDLETGNIIFEVRNERVFFILYEEAVKGRGYRYRGLQSFQCHISRIDFAYALNCDLYISLYGDRYVVPKVRNAELLAYYINKQMGEISGDGQQ